MTVAEDLALGRNSCLRRTGTWENAAAERVHRCVPRPFVRCWSGVKPRIHQGGNTMHPTLQVLLGLILFMGASVAAAAPPKDKEDPPDVVPGTVQKLTTSVDQYDDGRVVTKHTALVTVETVERTTPDSGRVIKAGETITVRWDRVTWPT